MNGKSFRIGRFVLRSEDPNIVWRRDNSRKQNVTDETFGGIGAGNNFPTIAVPVQYQGPELAGPIGREVTTKRPDVVGGIGRQSGQRVRVGPNVRAWHYLPSLAVPVQDQRAPGLPVRVRRREKAHGPSIVRRQRQYGLKPIRAFGYIRSRHFGPFRAVPVHGKRLAVCALESNRPGIIRGVGRYAQKRLTRRGLQYSCRRPCGAVPVLEKVEARPSSVSE